ncbi:D-tagatose-bisphosphate aldolase, class II, non-catalytic subunit [candidate division KSB1 bacterium]|nr:D-tagatose-bisphosphate aldolase, class II, non-catalytic subunit [candidate division KSB1 bacterium]
MLKEIINTHKQGKPVGIYSVCSSNPYVMEAAMQQAQKDDSVLLIESTSNQVDQFGGYTGMKPVDFVDYVKKCSKRMQFPFERIILGGDHLGPNVWQDQSAEKAMSFALEQVEAYVKAGYSKIHLDSSMRCADDPGDNGSALSTETIAERAALLCERSEKAAIDQTSKPVYIIGTEVPVPGGAHEDLDVLKPTSIIDLAETIEITKEAFYNKHLEAAWDRVIAVVVQPGVEFSDTTVVEYDPNSAKELSLFIIQNEQMVFEAHSTDYQRKESLREMVEDHFAILKVGPALTYAMREAVFALASIEEELNPLRKAWTLSRIRVALENIMLENPKYWVKHYHGNEDDQGFARKYSYSDRIRYYWPIPEIETALTQLVKNLSTIEIPLTLLSQTMPNQYWAVRNGLIKASPEDLIRHKVGEVLQMYASATEQGK